MFMRTLLVLFGAFLLLSLPSAATEYDFADPFPLISVSKKLSEIEVGLGSSVEVEVTVLNMGEGPAYDVEVQDLLANGTMQNRHIHVLGPKESSTLRYTVLPTALGRYEVGVAHVTYNLELGNANTQAKSLSNMVGEEQAYFNQETDDVNFRGGVAVLTPQQYARRHRSRYLEVASYIFLGAIPALFPYIFFRTKRAEEEVLLRRSKYIK